MPAMEMFLPSVSSPADRLFQNSLLTISSSLHLMAKPVLLACGSNGSAQLSIGHADDVNRLTPCAFHPSIEHLLPGSQIVDLVSSATHSLAVLRTDVASTRTPEPKEETRNILLGAGTNTLGQLGSRCVLWDSVKPETRFKPVDLLGPLGLSHDQWEPVMVAATWTTSFVVFRKRIRRDVGAMPRSMETADDEEQVEEMVLSCGSNDFGELGRADSQGESGRIAITSPSDKPTIVDLGLQPGETVELIKGGQRHVLAVVKQRNGDQRLIGWGAARKGELDPATLASTTSSSTMREASYGKTANSKGKGKAVSRATVLPPTILSLPLSEDERIVEIALGSAHTSALTSRGRVLAWGSDQKGQITGLGGLSGVQAIAASWGGSYCLALGSQPGKHRLYPQGSNTHSQLLRDYDSTQGPHEVELPDSLKIEGIVAGTEHILLYGTVLDGSSRRPALFAGGWNEHGNLGLGDEQDRPRLTEVEVDPNGGTDASSRIKRVWAGCAATWVLLDNA